MSDNYILLEIDNIILDQYVEEIDKLYNTFQKFLYIHFLYSTLSQTLNIFNVASIFFSIAFPKQHYSLIISLVGISLNNICNINTHRDKLKNILTVYTDHIIPDMENIIYEYFNKDIQEFIYQKKQKGIVNDSKLDYMEGLTKIRNLTKNNYKKFLGEMFTIPVSLTYINYKNIILCIILYLTIFIITPIIHLIHIKL